MPTDRTFGNMLNQKAVAKKPFDDKFIDPLRPQHIGPKVSKRPGAGVWSKLMKLGRTK